MKLFYDLFKSLFVRLAILLIVATALIVIEAHNQTQAYISDEEVRLNQSIRKIDDGIERYNRQITQQEQRQKLLEGQIRTKTQRINSINNTLKKSRNSSVFSGKKLNPADFSIKVYDLTKLNIERAGYAIEYSQLMFTIVNINKQIAQQAIKKTKLNNQLIIVQSSNYLDLILKQDSPTDLLAHSDWILLATLFYILFFGTLTLKAINFFLIAPIAKRTDPITITPDSNNKNQSIQYDAPQKEFKFELGQDNSLIVKPGWFSLNTDGTTRTRLFWELRNPFASYAMGLVNMTEFVPDKDRAREIKIASEQDPNRDIIPVQLKDHPGYIIKHGHVVATCGKDLHMKKVWGLWDWKNWLFGNLRYVFLTGTGTVYIHGYGSVPKRSLTTGSTISHFTIYSSRARAAFCNSSLMAREMTRSSEAYWRIYSELSASCSGFRSRRTSATRLHPAGVAACTVLYLPGIRTAFAIPRAARERA